MRIREFDLTGLGLRSSETPTPPAADEARMRVSHPDAHTAVITVVGELDELQAPRLEELLRMRLDSAVTTVVLDLERVEFVGVAAVDVLDCAYRRAEARGRRLIMRGHAPCLDRALIAVDRAGACSRP